MHDDVEPGLVTDSPRPRNSAQFTEMRRLDDERYLRLERYLQAVETKVDRVYDAISDPEQSVLGRQLLRRADTNAQNIEKLAVKVDDLESWRDQAKGSLALAKIAQILVAIAVGALTLYQFAVPK